MTREEALEYLKNFKDDQTWDGMPEEALEIAIKALEQEPIIDKIRDQLKSNLRGVEITLEVLVENDPLRPKMEGAKTTLEDCLELIDKAEIELQESEEE